jgi:hypothetical protein
MSHLSFPGMTSATCWHPVPVRTWVGLRFYRLSGYRSRRDGFGIPLVSAGSLAGGSRAVCPGDGPENSRRSGRAKKPPRRTSIARLLLPCIMLISAVSGRCGAPEEIVQATLADPRVREVTVVERLAPVIVWHRSGILPWSGATEISTDRAFRESPPAAAGNKLPFSGASFRNRVVMASR